MRPLSEYIVEAKAPQFSNSIEGITKFCEYVFDKQFMNWVVNPDKTITISSNTSSRNLYMDTKDLTEIPKFIVFSGIENVALGCGTDSKCKIVEWKPRVQGYCAGIILEDRPKMSKLDLSECEIRNGMLYVEKTGINSIVKAHGDGVKVFIKKNKNLEKLDIKAIDSCARGSYIVNNAKLKVDASNLPKGISVENNALKEKHYVS